MGDAFKKNGREYRKGEYLFHDGYIGQEMFILLEGSVDILKGEKNNEKVLATIRKGDFLGEMAILTNSPRSASARISSPTAKVLIINKVTFNSMIRSNPDIALKMLEKLSHRIAYSNMVIENLLFKSVDTKVVHYIRSIIKKNKVNNNEVTIDLSIEQIASSIHLKKEEVKVFLEKLKGTSFFEQLSDSKFFIKSLADFNDFYDFLYKKEKFIGIF